MPLSVTQRSLDLSILAMHAYNVGSNTHIRGEFFTNQIGNFTLISSQNYADGFGASAFRYGGDIVISYRGTNLSEGATDMLNGWGIALGGSAIDVPQISDAVSFYKSVVDQYASGNLFLSGITLTGHSLGGGLAGYVGAIYGQGATLFDNCAFEASADLDNLQSNLGSPYLNAILYKDGAVIDPDISGISTFYTSGEALVANRVVSAVPLTGLSSHSGVADPITLHSMALQVALQWADLNGPAGWEDGAKYIMESYLGGTVSSSLTSTLNGMSGGGDGSASVILQEVIAYSATSNGIQPFGDTALWSMFDDSANLGVSLSAGNRSSAFDAAKDYIGDVAVEYAARLALGQILASENGDARTGVLYLPENEGTLSIDFSKEKWTFDSSGENESDLKDELLEAATNASIGQPAFEAALWEYADHKGQSPDNPFDLVKSVSFSALQSGGASIDILPNASGLNVLFLQDGSGADAAGAGSDRTIIGSDSAESILGGDQSDIFLGGKGKDTLDGRGGDDFLYGGDGDDRIKTGAGADFVSGGAGNDIVETGAGSATVEFGVGDGKDVVDTSRDENCTIRLRDLNLNDITFVAGGGEDGIYWTLGEEYYYYSFVSIKINSTGEYITIADMDQVFTDLNTYHGYQDLTLGYDYAATHIPLPAIKFADGSTWSSSQIWSYIEDWRSHSNVQFILQEYSGGSGANTDNVPADFGDLTFINSKYFEPYHLAGPPEDFIGTGGDDSLSDGPGDDTLDGGEGDDLIESSGGNDTFIWNSGNGNDALYDWEAGDVDTLRLGSGITPAGLSFSLQGMDVVLSFAGEAGSVTLGGQVYPEVGVDRIEFADGLSWTREELLDAAMAGIVADAEPATAGDDNLGLPADRSAVAPGAGNDHLTASASGAATIVFAKGDGDDQLQNYASSIVRHDSLLLANILPHEVELQRSGDTLIINIVGTGDSFSALDQFKEDPDENFGLEQMVFADGHAWSWYDIYNLVEAGNQAPLAVAATASAIEGSESITGTFSATDPEEQRVSFSLAAPVEGLSLSADGHWTFDPGVSAYQSITQGQQLVVTANYIASDGYGGVSPSTLTITITGVNDAPVAAPELANIVAEGGSALDYTLPSGTFSDADGEPLTLTATLADGSPLPVWLEFANGHFTGQVPDDQLAFHRITVTASDGIASASTALYLTLTPPPADPPVNPPLGDIPYPETTNTVTFDPNAMIGTIANDYIAAPSGPAGGSNGNVLSGLDGNDWMVSESWSSSMDGGVGADVLEVRNSDFTVTGGGGSDYFVFDVGNFVGESWGLDPQYNWATITDFEDGLDKIAILNTAASFGALTLTQIGADVEITMAGAPKIVVAQTLVADLTADDFIVRLGGDAGTPPSGDAVVYPTPTNVVSYDSAQMDGTAANDSIFALSSSNGTSLLGRDGDDLLITESWASFVSGGAGTDVIEIRNDDVTAIGGAGYDYFVFDPAEFVGESWVLDPEFVWATITGFTSGEDKLAIGSTTYEDLTISQVGDNVEISMDGAPRIILRGTSASDIDASDFIFDTDPQQMLGYADTSMPAWEGPEHHFQPEMVTWFA